MKKLIKLLLVLFPIAAISQTQTENYIKTTTYKVESTSSIATPSALQASQNITYFDGLGRPVQQLAHQQSGTGKDIVTPIEYDAFGRQEKDYLPFVPTTTASLDYKTTALTEVGTFYNVPGYENTINPFSKKEFEASPLNRVLKQAAPGEDWKLGNGHEIRFDYQTNTIADKVRRFGVSFIAGNTENPYLEDQGIYDPSQLYKTITKDENWQVNQIYYPNYPDDHTTQEFKDKEGRVVLKRTFDANKWHDTYYVYDDYGNLTYVLPPKTVTYSNLGQQIQNQQTFFDYVHFFENDIDYFTEIQMFESNGKLECYFYAEYFFDEILKSGKIADLDFTPALPNMILGDIMMYNLKGEPIVAGTAYIRDGDLYFDSTGSVVYTDGSNATYTHFIINLADYQNNFTVPSLDRQTFNDLIYQYRYDKRNRLIEKKLPGKDWEYIIYDKLDRPVLTQDANLRVNQKWLFTKYDAFGRATYTGMHTNGTYLSRIDMQNYFDTQNNVANKMYESKTTSGTGYDNTYYSNVNFPNTGIEIYTVNYYDDYNFNTDGSTPVAPVVDTKGLATGNKVRILGTSNWITNVSGYDSKGRLIYSYSKNDYLGTTSTISNEFNFIGQTLKNTATHLRNGITTTTVDVFTYDHAGRLTKQTQAINGAVTPEVIVENVYDELGQLIQKKVGGKTTQNRLQTVDYTYNIRGWLKGINDSDTNYLTLTLGSGDLFGFQINYNRPSSQVKELYNGNISETYWKTNANLKHYSYSYDALNRFKKAKYSQDHDYGNYKFNETINNYDRNGNILGLFRYMEKPNDDTLSTPIDNLTYTYDKGNRLMKVDDDYKNSTDGAEGFKDGTNTGDDYSYDANGNMTRDYNKGIGTSSSDGITYNHLNLPTKITFNTGATIDYIYDASGVKQRKIVSTGTTTDYAGGFQYENNVLKFFPQPEGYVEYSSGNFNYIYQYKDHLGNVRLSYKDVSLTSIPSLLVLEENNYYPFGLKHKYNNNVVNSTNPALKYKYNGKELQDELGLNLYDYGNRNYDASIGRFHNMDRFSEKYLDNTPYHYTKNNPVFFIDVKGDSIAVYRPNGSYWKTVDDGKKEWSGRYYSKSKEMKKDGKVIGHKYSGMVNFEFADPESDTKDIQNTQIVYVDEKKIADMLGEAGALDPKNRYSFSYMNSESKGGGKLDFSYSSIPYNFAGASKDPLNNPSSMLFLPKGDNIAHNHMNFGNFLWGAAGSTLGFTRGTLQGAAHYNSVMNSDTNGYSPQLDSSDDQRSIKAGVSYSQEHQFTNRTWSPSAGISPKPER